MPVLNVEASMMDAREVVEWLQVWPRNRALPSVNLVRFGAVPMRGQMHDWE